MKKIKFKVGDKVKCLYPYITKNNHNLYGKIGVIMEIKNSVDGTDKLDIDVKFDNIVEEFYEHWLIHIIKCPKYLK